MSADKMTKEAKQKKQAVLFTGGSLPKQLLRFAVPYMLGVMVQNLYGAVDLWVVGHYATTADVSAVTVGSQLMNIATQLVIGLATGVTVLVGRSYGAQDERRLRKTVGTSIYLFGGAAVLVSVVYLACNRLFVGWMQTPAQAIAQTQSYLMVCGIGVVFVTGYNIINSILTGLGDSTTPFLFILIACVINVFLDVYLVRYCGMGAFAAAIATAAAQAGSFLFALVYLWRKGLGFSFGKRDMRFAAGEAVAISKIGAPIAVQNVLVGFSFLFIIAIINQMGVTASAAVGVVEKLISFLFVPAIGISTAVSTACSQNLGAGLPARAAKSMWWGVAMALVPSVLIALFCQFKGDWLTGLFSNDLAVVSLATSYLKSYIIDVVMVAVVFCMNGYFNSCNKSWFSLAHSLLTTFLVRVPAAYWFSVLPGTSLYVIGWAAPLSTLVSLVLCLAFMAQLAHQEKKQPRPA